MKGDVCGVELQLKKHMANSSFLKRNVHAGREGVYGTLRTI